MSNADDTPVQKTPRQRKSAFPFPAMLFSAARIIVPRIDKQQQQQQQQQHDHRRPRPSLSPLHIPPLLMGKLKKSKASPAASATPITQDEAILDDLFAQLDAQETNKPPPRKAPGSATPSTSSSDKKITMNGAMSSAKARFKVREVGLHFYFYFLSTSPFAFCPRCEIYEYIYKYIDTPVNYLL